MKGRERNKRAPPADLLVCFPTRSHLKLMPKPTTCSPSRPSSELTKRFLQHHHHHLRKSGASTSMLLLKNKHMDSDMSEPTSPKVTCAGQIKVRPKSGGSCKNWQSVMEEIEKLHKKNKKIKKPNWAEALGFKKDVMHFLTCLRTIRFDFRCFGSFPSVDITSSDDDDDEEEEEDKDNAEDDKYEQKQEKDDENENSKAVFSKWFMVLQENQDTKEVPPPTFDDQDHYQSANAPPSNALLLMRCRSAPAKSWLEEREQDEDENNEEEEEKEAKMVNEEEVKNKKILEENNLVIMNYDTDFYKLSCDIAKETWVVSGINKDQISRSRSCKR